MKRKTLGFRVAVAVAAGVLSASAFGLTVFGNNSQKGSLLIFPIIDTTGVVDTLITIVNDSSGSVRLKCYYATSQPIDTPNSSTAAQLRGRKHFMDFTIDVTHNQPFTFEASSGEIEGDSQKAAGIFAPPFGVYPDGFTFPRGELKCWAITDDGTAPRSYNHLFGKAAVVNADTGQAYEYNAWAFQALAPTGTPLGGSINGSVTVSDTVNPGFIPCSAGTIVGGCTSIHHIGLGNTGGGTGDFAGSNGATNAPLLDWVFATPGALINEIRIPGFAFDITSAVVQPKAPLICNATSCADALTISIFGIVTGGGLNPTPFSGSLALTGSCTGNGTACTGNFTAGYTYSLAASGPPPGELHLDNTQFDACPNILLGSFFPAGAPDGEDGEINPNTAVYLASCNQDLRQAFTPTITKLTWTFWNQDEQARTGTHFCADSWFETTFPAATWPLAQFAALGTNTAYFRIETTADTQICGPSAVTSAYVGVMAERFGTGFTRAVNLIGRGPAVGIIKFDILR